MLGDVDDAADAVQEAFVKAYRSLRRLREGSTFGPWFRTILRNHCRDRLRSSGGRTHVAWDERVAGDAGQAPAAAPAALERAELSQAVRNALARVSVEHREILVLKEMEGLSYAEIARETGIPAGTVASRLHHARIALRKVLVEGGISLEGVDR
jgi:RNA polymerase sigma factor (sigma-70 family)